ncbi:hypothetical protein KAK07_09925 [Ideonella sp. 4Y16]|uniref:Tetratricopeptide repeat protein n=1 Tax=Ideonella alba TaxID=2824118 RepID=A0A941BHZ3_9BURK|nr:hypothetical protein [Ideonella alba]MBQ0932148.1 hypothetical protein [Ideonella alba]MBQ0943654.1 hypothetical protein [Ideonella alba]
MTRTAAALLSTLLLIATPAPAADQGAADALAQAKSEIDTYYGDVQHLNRAAPLLLKALSAEPGNAAIYVQAARLTIKGGHVVASQFKPGTVEAYNELIDKALALDPALQKAHILKAEVHDIRRQYEQERLSLERARALGESDPWLWVGYARYYLKMGQSNQAFSTYLRVMRMGPGQGPEERNAYVGALNELAGFTLRPEDGVTLQDLGRRVREARHPQDAWALGNFAEQVLWRGMFDEAIDFSREALKTRDYGAARLTLAAALYGKAADQILLKQESGVQALLDEAAALGVSRQRILQHLAEDTPEARRRAPVLERIVR